MLPEWLRALLSRAAGQAILATILIIGTFGLLFAHVDVPEWLVVFDSAALSAFFTAVIVSNGK